MIMLLNYKSKQLVVHFMFVMLFVFQIMQMHKYTASCLLVSSSHFILAIFNKPLVLLGMGILNVNEIYVHVYFRCITHIASFIVDLFPVCIHCSLCAFQVRAQTNEYGKEQENKSMAKGFIKARKISRSTYP